MNESTAHQIQILRSMVQVIQTRLDALLEETPIQNPADHLDHVALVDLG